MKKAQIGYEIKVGDIIQRKTTFSITKYEVHRVTPKFAFIKYNNVAEGKYPRVVKELFSELPKQKFSVATYKVYIN